jgi:hypothetical protein
MMMFILGVILGVYTGAATATNKAECAVQSLRPGIGG